MPKRRSRRRVRQGGVVPSRDAGAAKKVALSPDTARSIYIDFEGTKNAPPTLLGVLIPRSKRAAEFEQFVFEELFFQAAEATHRQCAGLQEVIEGLVNLAEKENLQLVAWSHHELKLIRKMVSTDLADRFEARYRDAKKTARRWMHKAHPDIELERGWSGRYRLARIMELAGYEDVPSEYGPDLAGGHLRRVRAHLKTKAGDFGSLKDDAKRNWTDLLEHNRHDCFGMRHVDERAIRELAGVTSARDTSPPVVKVKSRTGRPCRYCQQSIRREQTPTEEDGRYKLLRRWVHADDGSSSRAKPEQHSAAPMPRKPKTVVGANGRVTNKWPKKPKKKRAIATSFETNRGRH